MPTPTCFRLFWLVSLFALGCHAQQQSPGAEALMNRCAITHGVLMGVAFAILFPIGAMLVRFPHLRLSIWIHAAWQACSYAIVLAGFGIGVWMAVTSDQLVTSNGHAIIGIIVTGVLVLQPLSGLIAHKIYKRSGRVNNAGRAHRWIGRLFLTLGVINGGLGLQLSDDTTKGEIAYGVIAGFFLLWIGVVIWNAIVDKREKRIEEGPGMKA